MKPRGLRFAQSAERGFLRGGLGAGAGEREKFGIVEPVAKAKPSLERPRARQ